MMLRTLGLTLAWTLAASHLAAAQAPPSPTSPSQDPVTRFLDTCWDSSKANREAAAREWDRLGGDAIEDRSLLLAYLANLVNHHRYDQARQLAERLTQVHPDELRGWELKIWLDAVVNEYDLAIAGIREFKLRIDSELPDDAELIPYARRLGSLMAYFDGPVHDRINPGTLLAAEDTFPGKWSPAAQEAFADARQRVQSQFEELVERNEGRIKTEATRKAVEVATEKDQLQRDRIALREQLENLLPERERVANEAVQQVAQARQQIEPIQQAGADLSIQIRNRELDVVRLNREFLYFQSLDPYHPSLIFIVADLRQARFDLSSLYSQARGLELDLAQAQANLRNVERRYEGQLAAIDREMLAMQTALDRNVSDENRLDRKPLVAANKKQALAERARSLTTYDPYPIEILRQDLLTRQRRN